MTCSCWGGQADNQFDWVPHGKASQPPPQRLRIRMPHGIICHRHSCHPQTRTTCIAGVRGRRCVLGAVWSLQRNHNVWRPHRSTALQRPAGGAGEVGKRGERCSRRVAAHECSVPRQPGATECASSQTARAVPHTPKVQHGPHPIKCSMTDAGRASACGGCSRRSRLYSAAR